MHMTFVLVIDDDQAVLKLVQKALKDSDVDLHTAQSAQEGLAALRQNSPDVLLLDISLPDASGLEMANRVRNIDPKLPIVFITVSDDSHTAIEAMKVGAYDILIKPLSLDSVRNVIIRAIEMRRLMGVPVAIPELDEIKDAADEHDQLVGRSPAMLGLYKEIGRIATQDVSVLICGESGTGKELVARAIYQHSSRSDRHFLAVNCAALSDTLLESELFGHEKGAFTGADRQRNGKFEQCNGGTIFLDEVGDMSPATQSKVLRILQEQQFERVGGNETIETNVRIISATNRDLDQMIEDGKFRMDLYHRLNGYRLDMPPLRDRGNDIMLLIRFFLAKYSKELNKDAPVVSPEALEMLTTYAWPGNVRELQTVLRTAILKATGHVITPELFPYTMSVVSPVRELSDNDVFLPCNIEEFVDEREKSRSHDLYAETLEMMEHYLITRVLRETDGNQSKAAEMLGITRGSLRNKIHSLGISIGHVVQLSE
jgi:DNA-binding NtrC family response regulator